MVKTQGDIWGEKDKTPRHIPFDPTGWEKPVYHKEKKWVAPEMRRDEAKSRRRLERDPNHPTFKQRYGLLQWMGIRVTLIGTDPEGRSVISIRKGASEPIYIRFGTNQIELFRAGKKITW